MSTYTFTSESVTEGHPDKMADQISDSVLDAILTDDPNGRVACETMVTTGLCVVAGEISHRAGKNTLCVAGHAKLQHVVTPKHPAPPAARPRARQRRRVWSGCVSRVAPRCACSAPLPSCRSR